MFSNAKRKGFTLIELLIVVVIIGILAAIAIPKFAATKDKAKLASVKTDVRNFMSAQEGYFSDNARYAVPTAMPNTIFTPSSGNAVTGTAAAPTKGYTLTITNGSITSGATSCTVKVGGDATVAGTEGVITCP